MVVCVFLLQTHVFADIPDKNTSAKLDKNHHFFVGINLSIPHGDAFYPIERIWNTRAQIRVDDEVIVEEIKDFEELKFTKTTKVSRNFVEISDLKCEPTYSLYQDPQVKSLRNRENFATMASDSMAIFDSVVRMHYSLAALTGDITEAEIPDRSGIAQLSFGSNAVETTSKPVGIGSRWRELQVSESIESMSRLEQSKFSQESQNSEEPLNALRVRFSIRSDTDFSRAHMVFLFQLKDPSDENELMSWIHFLSLKDISKEGNSYDYYIDSYPDGMLIDSQQIFLYANGSEIATNLSPKHVGMTEREARTYINYQYLARNEGKTKPPERMWNYLSDEFHKSLHADLADEKITLKINEEGVVTDLIMNPAVSTALNPQNIREISSQLYLPALREGKAVPGELVLMLSNLVF